jgi:cystathionine beta-lyase
VALRFAAQDAAARRIAQWALGRREFVRVLNPATPGSPGHAHWAAQCRAAAGLVTVEFDPAFAAARVDRFVDDLRLFGIGWSWAGPISLAVPYQPGTGRVPGAVHKGSLVRLSIGFEDVDDLIGDLEQALERMSSAAGAS